MRTEAELKVAGKVVPVSNLQKVLYPKVGFTKADVINYYIKVSAALLPHLKNRPLTLKRYPNGVEAPFFYEKECPAHRPKWVRTTAVTRTHENSHINFCVVNDLPTLVWTANLADLELHTSLAKAGKVDCPTMVVFDLDPGPPANVLQCASVALRLKDLLGSLKLECFAKSSGSKGLQVYLPLNSSATYEQTKPFAKAIAETLEKRYPQEIVSSMSKNLRAGKVFIDWSQNDDHKTTICVYSLRAKEKPYVSAPLSWAEVRDGLEKKRVDQFFLEPDQVIERVKQLGDLFAPVLSLKQKIPAQHAKALETWPGPAVKPTKSARAAASSSKDDLSLRKYNAKRDFKKTAEPVGQPTGRQARAGELLFVIQKHAASRLHYDFRLEMAGVLKSWAVPKGIPTKKGEKNLAVHVEDHPLDYARFEGTIPQGQYGGGTVMVWDLGTYAVYGDDPLGALRDGKIHFSLHGKKLDGDWTLIKFRHSREGEKDQWLLLKSDADVPPISTKEDDRSALTSRSMAQIAEDNDAQWKSNREPGRVNKDGRLRRNQFVS